jgi:Flp pilus assembly protein TadG
MSQVPCAASIASARMLNACRQVWARAASWPGAVAGVAAVEFAMVLPVMVMMLLGMSEVTLGVNIDRKLTLLSRSLADLSSRAGDITTSGMDDIFKASSIVMQPHSTTGLTMVVSSMKVTKVGSAFNGSVEWSCPRGSGAVAKPSGVTYPVPSGFQTDNTYYMLIEVSLPYTPTFGRTITGTINLSGTTPWPIRNATKVTLTGGCPSTT